MKRRSNCLNSSITESACSHRDNTFRDLRSWHPPNSDEPTPLPAALVGRGDGRSGTVLLDLPATKLSDAAILDVVPTVQRSVESRDLLEPADQPNLFEPTDWQWRKGRHGKPPRCTNLYWHKAAVQRDRDHKLVGFGGRAVRTSANGAAVPATRRGGSRSTSPSCRSCCSISFKEEG
jgi:hypothetical protein